MAESQNPTDPQEDRERESQESGGESRRQFVKKLPYIVPVMETFLLSTNTEVFGGDDDDDDDKKKRKKKTSPTSSVLPPPLPPGDDDDDDD